MKRNDRGVSGADAPAGETEARDVGDVASMRNNSRAEREKQEENTQRVKRMLLSTKHTNARRDRLLLAFHSLRKPLANACDLLGSVLETTCFC